MVAQLEQELIDFRRTTVDKLVNSKLLNDGCKMENYLKFEVSGLFWTRLLLPELSFLKSITIFIDNESMRFAEETMKKKHPTENITIIVDNISTGFDLKVCTQNKNQNEEPA